MGLGMAFEDWPDMAVVMALLLPRRGAGGAIESDRAALIGV